jgi:RNA polymerase sigma-70 factor (ECF subfamily)
MMRYVAGDLAAFEDLYRLASPRLFGYLLRLTRHRERAEDLVQITFSKVHRARQSYLAGAPLLPWMLAIARRSFLDERRRHKVRPEDLTKDGSVPEPTPRIHSSGDDLADTVEQALQKLPETYAEAIQLTKITGLSMAEAAEVLGTTATAVKLRVHRGYNILRKELEAHGRNF